MQNYTFDIVSVKGKENGAPDALSSIQIRTMNETPETQFVATPMTEKITSILKKPN